MDAIEAAAMADGATLDGAARDQWARIQAGVQPLLQEPHLHEGDDVVELSDMATGLQLTMTPGELAMSVPYWHTDDAAVDVTALLRQVAEIVERETGLVAYDPQADDGFLTAGADHAAATMTTVRERMETHLGASAPQPPTPWWRRLFGR